MLFLRVARYPVFSRNAVTNVSDVTVTCFIYCKIIQIAFQTELTCQRIQEFETQASSDLELRNNKIDELNRVSVVVISLCTYPIALILDRII